MLIDLTKTISEDLKGYLGDPQTTLTQLKTVDHDGYSLYQLSMGMHTGTHIDGPRHMLNDGWMVDEIPVDRLLGRGVIIDASKVSKLTDQHPGVVDIMDNDTVLVYGGQTKTVIDASFASVLVRKNVNMLGIDFASPDEEPFDVHKLLFMKNIFIVEHLCNLDQLLDKNSFDVIVAPLKVHSDGAPVRVFAKI